MSILRTYLTCILKLLLLLIFFIPLHLFSQTTVTFCSSGCTFGTSGTWTVPCGVTSITVECIGGGGAGGGDGTDNSVGSAGGGGGAYARSVITVSGGNTFVWSAGSAGVASSGAGTNGGNTTFGTTLIVAEGGKGGGTNGGAAGSGGLVINSTGDVTFSGGTGAGNSGATGGGGGGTGGSASNGNNGGNPAGATAVTDGYAGGNGGAADGAAGNAPAAGQYGGGGGGSGDRSGGSENGGAGNSGFIKITYTAPTISPGTYTIGPSGDNFYSIGSALSCLPSPITGAYIFELQPDYLSSVETFPMTLTAVSGASSTNTITIRPASGATGLAIQANPGSAIDLITFNNADYFIFDGRPGGTGSNRELTIRNTRTTATIGSTITFINDASNNTLTYLNIESERVQDDFGIIHFSTTTATTGNDNNTISYSHIRDLSSGGTGALPRNGITSIGTATKENSGNVIDNCHFYDIYEIGVDDTWDVITVFLKTANNSWNITNNHFYQTTSYSGLDGNMNFIRMDEGGGYTITGNFIGGTAPGCGGTPFTISSVKGQVLGINFEPTCSGAANTINNNTISNINFTTTVTAVAGIKTVMFGAIITRGSSNFTVGFSGNGNVIGSASSEDNIVITHNGTILNHSYVIVNQSAGEVHIDYNSIGGITLAGTRVSPLSRIILSTAGTAASTIEKNEIGTAKIKKTTAAGEVNGIEITGGSGKILRNKIVGLVHSVNSSTTDLNGIKIAGTTWDVHNNVVIIDDAANSDINIYGIYDNNASTLNLYHNTVKIGGTGSGTSKTAALLRNAAGTDNVQNNIFQNTRSGGSGGNYAIYAGTAAGTFTNDDNYLEVTDNTAKLGFWSGSDQTLANWITNTSATAETITGTTAIDANGYVPPAFVGADAGTDLFTGSIVTVDKTDFPRDINPWMGAYEYSTGNMSYNSSTTTQTNTSGLAKGSANNLIIGVEILMNNTDNPLAATSFTFNTTGTTNPPTDIQNARLWATGNSNGFATTTQLGAAVVAPNGTFTITGFSYTLNPGNNYFWLTYDIPSGATAGNNVDAECTSLIVDAISRTPTVTAPAGFRIIGTVFSVCPGGCDYTSIQLAYNAVPASLTDNYFIQLSSAYTDVNEPATGIIFAAKTMNGYFITVRPAAGVTGKIVDFAPGALNNLWTFDGAKNVIIDGRPGGIGSNCEFTIRNTGTPSVNSTVFNFVNDASNNILTYLNIEGDVAVADNKGLILFSTTTGTTGNDNNTISFCHIRDWSVADGGNAALPRFGIFCFGTSGKENSGNTVDNCQFYNICETSDASYNSFNIYLVTGADAWTITNNHFYQTTSYSYTVASSIQPFGFIAIDATGGSYIVSGNYCGGTATNAGGAAFTITGGDRSLQSILFNGTVTAGANTITNNTIANINITTSYTGTLTPFVGIAALHNSNFTIGASGNGNIIGSAGAIGGITLTQNGTQLRGIRAIVTTGTGTNTVSYNAISGLTVGGSLAGADTRFISCDGSGTYNIFNNNLGSANNNSVVSSNSKLTGIFVNTGGGSIKKNFITGLTNTAAAGTRAIIGMDIAGTTWDVHNNVVILDNGANTNDMPVYGIQDNNSSTLNIYHNTVKIYGTGTGTSFTAAHYRLLAGTDNVKNNIFQNTRTGGTGGNYSIYAAVTTGTFTNDDNYLEVTENTAKLGFWSGTDQTLANWITNTSATAETITGTTAIDADGKAPSGFVGANAGADLFTGSIVVDDFEGTARDAAPWMGAYESGACILPTITLGANPTVCSGATSANLTYSTTTESPDQYSIDYDATAEGQGFADVTNAALPASPIVLTVPGAAAAGTYNYTVTVRNSGTGCVSSGYAKTVTIPANGGAGTWTWVGGISTNWFDPCNWDTKSLPDLDSDVVIPGGTVNDPTITGAAANCKTLTIDTGNSGIVNLNSTAGGVLNVAQ